MGTLEITLPLHTSVRNFPKNLRSGDHQIFASSRFHEISPASIERLRGVEAFGRGPLRHEGRYLQESFVTPAHAETWRRERGHLRAAAERLIQSRSVIQSPTIWITDNWSCGYYHWMCDALSRLEMASQSHDLSAMTLLLPYKYRKHTYMQQSLKPFGLGEVRFLKRFERVLCHNLILPSHVAVSGNHSQPIIQRMHQRFTEYLAESSAANDNSVVSEFGDRVFISRSMATRRRIANEEAILPVLKRHGFTVFTAEKHDWRVQVQVAAAAKYLVSNHGAGLTNMMMMTPRSRVLEIRDAVDPTPNCYFSLASASRLDYYYALAHRVDSEQCVHHGDVNVDPEQLDATLAEMVAV
ncbi:glycosyltransferase family 61 protein [Novipirellula sp. SH528]|uniref:glycosyltransferase family 61 protein n=1 Tax=Novipirellula sp. SH528 TaxID=3454466 RepID=UPI003FA165DD